MLYKPGSLFAGIFLILFLLPALAFASGESFFVQKEGFVECADSTAPRGADLQGENAIAGYTDGFFPVGLTCLWDMKGGTTSTTFPQDDWTPTFLIYGCLLIGAGGSALLVRRRLSWSSEAETATA